VCCVCYREIVKRLDMWGVDMLFVVRGYLNLVIVSAGLFASHLS
jgi:hypothetical protein